MELRIFLWQEYSWEKTWDTHHVRPSACMKVLEHYGIDCTGKKVVVIGRSLVVGKPAAMMLLKKNATVTVCHTRTVDMPSVVKRRIL